MHHVIFECREWRGQIATLYWALDRVGIIFPLVANVYLKGRLLGEPKATNAVVEFLAATRIAQPTGYVQQTVERTRQNDYWGWKP